MDTSEPFEDRLWSFTWGKDDHCGVRLDCFPSRASFSKCPSVIAKVVRRVGILVLQVTPSDHRIAELKHGPL